ncbi:hypothetical protein MAR_023167, partial [Mya arenaria]
MSTFTDLLITRPLQCVTVCTAAIDYVDDYEGPTHFIPQPKNLTLKPGLTAFLRCSVENLDKRY